jgi:CRISPR-associated endonuclease/helicase Cas3
VTSKMASVNSGLIVCNTIHNAAYLANSFRQDKLFKIYEMTGWQTPMHKEQILKEIKRTIKKEKTLVIATSTIECGVNISFDIGWREKCGALNVLQFAGRINRNATSSSAMVYVYEWDRSLFGKDSPFTSNPQLSNGISVLNALNPADISPDTSSHIVSLELQLNNNSLVPLLKMEEWRQFHNIDQNFSVIDSATAIVVTDKNLISRIKAGEQVQYNEIIRKSVQLWTDKIERLQQFISITPIVDKTYFVWEEEYCEQSGIAKVMLRVGR